MEYFTIGTAANNDFQVANDHVSRHHARLIKSLRGLEIEDLGSTNHTYVNGEAVTRSKVHVGDSISLSTSWKLDWTSPSLKAWIDRPLEINTPESVPSESREESVWELDLDNSRMSTLRIGRDPGNDLRIMHPRVSRQHAVLEKKDGYWLIKDLGSTNGTFVDGKRIKQAAVTPERSVRIAGLPVSLFPFSGISIKESYAAGEAEINLESIRFTVRDGSGFKTILHDMSLVIPPGEFVGLIGPSGSGKTTLMLMVNGYNIPSHGKVRINGINLHSNARSFQGFVGYVPQDDIIHRELTVERSLMYSAQLRLPFHSGSERREEVDRVIRDLGLESTRNVIIGKPEKKGISGGQRKRVNLAQELITQPSILLLDEPCSGLDPQSDRNVMMLLRDLCNNGKSVLLTTHNITQHNFEMMDKLIVLSEGGYLAYYGPSEEAADYFGVSTPEKIFTELESRKPVEWNERYRLSPYSRYMKTDDGLRDESSLVEPAPKRKSIISQLVVLSTRFAEIKWRDRLQTAILFAQAPIIGLLLALVFGSSETADNQFPSVMPLFLLVISAIWLGASNATREIVSERAIFRRETKVFLGIGNYILSKLIILASFSAIQCFILLACSYSFCEIAGSFWSIYAVLLLVSVSATCLGLLISSLSTSEASAMALVPIILIPQVVLGGMILRLRHMSGIVKIIAGAMISRWGFEAAIISEDKALSNLFPSGQLLSSFGFDVSNFGIDIAVVLGWSITYLVVTYSVLKKRI